MCKKRLRISSLFYFRLRTAEVSKSMTKKLKTTRNLKVIEQPALCVAEGKVGYGKKKSDCGRGGTSDLMMRY